MATHPTRTTSPAPSPQADGTPESLHKVEKTAATERPPARSHVETEDEHIGATEDQVTPTTPPSPDDDEPKQG